MKITAAIFTAIASLSSIALAQTTAGDTYDYVIVGGGVAGLALANRLSEDKDVTVAVLESGPNAENQFVIYAPGMYGQAVGSELCPLLPTVPQEGMNNRSLTIATGRLLGGGSAINGLVWTRGGLKDYDAWEELGNPGWNGEEMFKYFKKVENFTLPTTEQAEYGATALKEVHGTKGPIDISFTNFEFPQSRYWNASLDSLDFNAVPDLLNGSLHGYSVTPNTLNPDTVRRTDAYTGYIAPYSHRNNLFVLANHTVSRVEFEKQKSGSLVATGVEWYPTGSKDKKQTLKARMEVILSAGAIGSPKLLEVSGVGNKDILSSVGVKALLDLPGVGSNLQDHVHGVVVSTTNITGYTTNSVFTNDDLAQEMKEEYVKNKTGIWTTTPNNLGYPSPSQLFKSTAVSSGKNFAEMIRDYSEKYAEYYATTNATNTDLIKKQYGIIADRYESDYLSPIEINLTPGYGGTGNADIKNNKYQTVNHVLIAPLSRGYTHINSSDIEEPVIINPQYYTHPLDLELHAASFKLAREIISAPAGLGQLNSGEAEPGMNVTSDEDIKAWLASNVRSDWHPVGTCAMLPEDLGGVVDASLKVYGTSNLRIVDASIIPLEVSSHLMQPTYGIAEKAADIIKADRK
ncbi:alcohol oxidase [Blakeslea trispora]|nr:alcohol oxidase [Blakeslea trispora]